MAEAKAAAVAILCTHIINPRRKHKLEIVTFHLNYALFTKHIRSLKLIKQFEGSERMMPDADNYALCSQ